MGFAGGVWTETPNSPGERGLLGGDARSVIPLAVEHECPGGRKIHTEAVFVLEPDGPVPVCTLPNSRVIQPDG